jgi:hypothetical protein
MCSSSKEMNIESFTTKTGVTRTVLPCFPHHGYNASTHCNLLDCMVLYSIIKSSVNYLNIISTKLARRLVRPYCCEPLVWQLAACRPTQLAGKAAVTPKNFCWWLVSTKPLPLKPHDRKPKPQVHI